MKKLITCFLLVFFFASSAWAISPLHKKLIGTWEGKTIKNSPGDPEILVRFILGEKHFERYAKFPKYKEYINYHQSRDNPSGKKKLEIIQEVDGKTLALGFYDKTYFLGKKVYFLKDKGNDTIELVEFKKDEKTIDMIHRLKRANKRQKTSNSQSSEDSKSKYTFQDLIGTWKSESMTRIIRQDEMVLKIADWHKGSKSFIIRVQSEDKDSLIFTERVYKTIPESEIIAKITFLGPSKIKWEDPKGEVKTTVWTKVE